MAKPTQFFGSGQGGIELRPDFSSSEALNHLLRTGRGLVLDLKRSFR
jgi:hypothetical protein